ncbi:unnamed protein product [Lactuca virosa]|uniref:MATH domain-containing protein n=1 Tax=Lactuca virosa TaxID=75947 RepID=A0AAU9P0J4_9ASTR|nr:unnamed protein product [Lactuca virosa]
MVMPVSTSLSSPLPLSSTGSMVQNEVCHRSFPNVGTYSWRLVVLEDGGGSVGVLECVFSKERKRDENHVIRRKLSNSIHLLCSFIRIWSGTCSFSNCIITKFIPKSHCNQSCELAPFPVSYWIDLLRQIAASINASQFCFCTASSDFVFYNFHSVADFYSTQSPLKDFTLQYHT